jgi:hypothetical protein
MQVRVERQVCSDEVKARGLGVPLSVVLVCRCLEFDGGWVRVKMCLLRLYFGGVAGSHPAVDAGVRQLLEVDGVERAGMWRVRDDACFLGIVFVVALGLF